MNLAVVIPAYKPTFLGKALQCLADQTDKKFRIYIGDDFSPHELWPIVDRFHKVLDIKYTRYETNIGAPRLVDQWTRCMALLQDEDWVWFFSDDDLASPNCVAALRARQRQTSAEVLRFNTCTIDGEDNVIGRTVSGPDFESSASMALNLLRWQRGNSMPDHTFSRDVYLRKGGFVWTEYAQAADWATSILFSQDRGIYIVQEGLVKWRRAGTSISANVSTHRAEKMKGHYTFIAWLLKHFEYLNERPVDGITFDQVQNAAQQNLKEVIVSHYRGMPPGMYLYHLNFMRRQFGYSSLSSIRHLYSTIYSRAKLQVKSGFRA